MSRIELAVEKVKHLNEKQAEALLEWLDMFISITSSNATLVSPSNWRSQTKENSIGKKKANPRRKYSEK